MPRVLPWKVYIPLVTGVVVSLAILAFAEFGFARLGEAQRRMAAALEAETLVNEILTAVVDAETAQRGFLLTGRDEYLEPYRSALPRIEERYKRLRELVVFHADLGTLEHSGRLNALIGKKLAEIDATLELYRKSGPDAALDLLRTDLGRRSMDAVRAEARAMSAKLRSQLGAGTDRWHEDVRVARLGMQLMTAFTVALLLVVLVLARREFRHREERRLFAVERQQKLEALVDERTAELSELSTHLQGVREEEKAKLARDIHDELGGILVAAKMDVESVHRQVTALDPAAAGRLARAMAALDSGVDVKRRIIEELRPTLLDNLGLQTALDWLVTEGCQRAGLECELNLSAAVTLPPEQSIAVYRIVQEALTNIVRYAEAKHVSVDLLRGDGSWTLVVSDDGIGIAEAASRNRLSHGINGMRQRARALGGEFSIRGRPGEGTVIEVTVPVPPRGDTAPGPAGDAPPAGAAPARLAQTGG
jgi:signal transduction histidine kinase